MNSTISLAPGRISCVLLILFCVSALVAQTRGSRAAENFNSPTPILLSETDSTRALTENPFGREFGRTGKTVEPKAYQPGSTITLYVTNLALLPGESANAFRVYGEDSRGYSYRFPVLAMKPVAGLSNVWAMTTLLSDEIGFYPPPVANGDILIYLAWRGLASNKTRLGLGVVGGDIKEDPTARPTPVGPTSVANAIETVASPRGSDRSRFMEQAGFGPTPTTETTLASKKLSRWIQEQFLLPYPSASNPYPSQLLKPDSPQTDCDGDATVPDNPATCNRDSYSLYPIQTWNQKEMLYGDNPLRHKVTWALSQIWVTSGVDIQQSRQMVEYHKILSANAFGNFRTLMIQMTKNPEMGQYLSMIESTKNNPNENYAREIMQLFTIGLFMLNPDGTVQCVENNPCHLGDTEIPTYDQNVVNNLTRVFTGWNLCNLSTCPSIQNGQVLPGVRNLIDPLIVPSAGGHDTGAKTLLSYPNAVNTNIAACPPSGQAGACTGGTSAQNLANTQAYAASTMDQALDNIFYHPNVGPFISKTLIQHMVTSDPSPAYVGRVAAKFNNNGSGVRGDMKAVIYAILMDPEARGDVKTDPNYGKLREPVQYASALLRILNVKSADLSTQSDGVVTRNFGTYTAMGQTPFMSPTVFNYYSPGFVIPGTTLLGPEFGLMTTGTAIARANFVNRVVFSSPIVAVNNPDDPLGTAVDMSDLLAISASDVSGNALLDELDRRMLHRTMSASMRSTILTALAPTSATDLARVRQAVYLIATSSQYQVQR